MEGYRLYPLLNEDIELHYTPTGSTMFVQGEPRELNGTQTAFIEKCNGQETVGDIVLGCLDHDTPDRLGLLVFVNSLLTNKLITLEEEATRSDIRITGSKDAYLPVHLTVELTAGCNLRCHHCYRESGPEKNGHLPTDELLGVLSDLHANGLRSVELTGGEPLLHKDFIKIFRFCVEKFDLVGVLTNGTVMNEAIYDTLVAYKDASFLSISLDGSTAPSHDQRRGVPGSFDKTTKNIKSLSANGVKVRVSMSVDENNFGDIENTLLVSKEMGATSFSYTPVMPLGRGKGWAGLKWQMDARSAYKQEQSLQERYEGFLSVLPEDKQDELEDGGSCGAGYRTFTMNPYGKIRPCAMYDENKYVIGDLTRQSVLDVFKNTMTEKLAAFPMPAPETCAGCENELFCRYCGLRGLEGSTKQANCRWINHPSVKDVMSGWEKNAL